MTCLLPKYPMRASSSKYEYNYHSLYREYMRIIEHIRLINDEESLITNAPFTFTNSDPIFVFLQIGLVTLNDFSLVKTDHSDDRGIHYFYSGALKLTLRGVWFKHMDISLGFEKKRRFIYFVYACDCVYKPDFSDKKIAFFTINCLA